MKNKGIDAKTFGELLERVRERACVASVTRRFVVEASGVRAIRERTGLSQSEFADLIGVSIKTLQNWEQDHRPTGPAASAVADHRA